MVHSEFLKVYGKHLPASLNIFRKIRRGEYVPAVLKIEITDSGELKWTASGRVLQNPVLDGIEFVGQEFIGKEIAPYKLGSGGAPPTLCWIDGPHGQGLPEGSKYTQETIEKAEYRLHAYADSCKSMSEVGRLAQV